MTTCLGSMTGRVLCNSLIPRQKNVLSEINTASPTFIQHKDMYGDVNTVFNVNVVHLLDRVFTCDSLSFLSNEQTLFMQEFFKQAHEVTESLTYEEAYSNMTEPMYRLDGFLGGFTGGNNEYKR